MTTLSRRGIIIIPKAYTPNWDITINGLNVDNELENIDIS